MNVMYALKCGRESRAQELGSSSKVELTFHTCCPKQVSGSPGKQSLIQEAWKGRPSGTGSTTSAQSSYR